MSIIHDIATICALGGISATISPSSVFGSGSGFSSCGNPGSSGTASVTVTPSGSYTYAWSRTSGASASGGFTANSPTSSSSSFRDSNNNVCDADSPNSETWKCTIDGTIDTDNTVSVTITWVNLS